jgi:hypothetical protein
MYTALDVCVPRQYYMKRKGNDSSDNYVDLPITGVQETEYTNGFYIEGPSLFLEVKT